MLLRKFEMLMDTRIMPLNKYDGKGENSVAHLKKENEITLRLAVITKLLLSKDFDTAVNFARFSKHI